MIEESYVSFDTAKLLKDAGFRELTKTHYSNSGQVWETAMPADYNDDFNCNTCNRPTLALAARWLREVHDTFVNMERVGSFDGKEFRFYWSFSIISVSTACLKSISGGRYDGYEEALEVGIVQVLERIIEETKE